MIAQPNEYQNDNYFYKHPEKSRHAAVVFGAGLKSGHSFLSDHALL
jgi:hypothetical protein